VRIVRYICQDFRPVRQMPISFGDPSFVSPSAVHKASVSLARLEELTFEARPLSSKLCQDLC
jgi:hypothetical protein